MSADPVVIVSAARTPIGKFQGVFSGMSAPQLGAVVIKAALERAGIERRQVQALVLGCVLPAASSRAPARQAAVEAGLPPTVQCLSVSKIGGSGMKAVMLAHDMLLAGSNEIIVAGGMESVTNAHYCLPTAKAGRGFVDGQVLEHMLFDGLQHAFGRHSRVLRGFAEDCADEYGFSKQDQDAYAITSISRARRAIEMGAFSREIVPVMGTDRTGETLVVHDEQPPTARNNNLSHLTSFFEAEVAATVADTRFIADGAAALLMMRQSTAKRLGLVPIAAIWGHASYAHEPRRFPTAPIGAMKRLLTRIDWAASDVDLWEIDEGFPVSVMAAIRTMALHYDKVNIHGGACALGNPIGASGARLVVTLISALKTYGGRRGVASMGLDDGEAGAIAIKMF